MARSNIADDDDVIGEIACNALMAGGRAAGLITNGRDALGVIRARKPDLVVELAYFTGADDYLEKPFEPAEFVSRLRALITAQWEPRLMGQRCVPLLYRRADRWT